MMDFSVWQSRTEEFIIEAFGRQSWQAIRFAEIKWRYSPRSLTPNVDHSAMRASTFEFAKKNAQTLLSECISDLKNFSMDSKKLHSQDFPRKIFITHGRNPEWMEVQRYIEQNLKFPTLELSQAVSLGRTVIEKLEQESEKCGYAIIVMSGDDSGEDGSLRVRENVMHEIGWFQARYGRGKVCLLHEEGVSIPSNMSGLVYISYPKTRIRSAFSDLRDEIEAVYGKLDTQ